MGVGRIHEEVGQVRRSVDERGMTKDDWIMKLAERLYQCFEILQRHAERRTKGSAKMDSMRLLAYVQCLMMALEGERLEVRNHHYPRLEKLETYLIRRVNRGVF